MVKFNYILVLLVAYILFFTASCSNDVNVENLKDGITSLLSEEKVPGKNIVVYCDLSKSIDSSAAQAIIRKVSDLYSRFDKNSHFYIYSVNQAIGSNYLVKSEIPDELSDDTNTPLAVQRRKEKIKSIQDSILQVIEQKLYETYLSTPNADNSCIVDKIDKAVDIFKSMEKGRDEYLFIFSDMVEDCDKSQIGNTNISMENDSNFEFINKAIEEKLNPLSRFEEDVNFFVIQTTSKQNNLKNPMSSNHIKILWNNIFSKYNLTTDSTSVDFSLEVPKNL